MASRVRRRRAVRSTSITLGTLASVTLAAFGAQAAVRILDQDPAVPIGPSPSSTPSPSWSPSPSPFPEVALPVHADGTYVPPLPTGEAPGIVTENGILRLVPDAVSPVQSGVPSESVRCNAPVGGTFVDPLFDEASARIIKPDTLYPTFLDPAYETEEGDVLLGLWSWGGTTEVDRSYLAPAGAFFVAVSYRSVALESAWVYDSESDTFRGGATASYTLVERQGQITADEMQIEATNDIDLAFGTVLVQNGVVVGHTQLDRAILAEGTPIMTINESEASDGTTSIVYDFAVGPLEHIVWCGGRPSGPVDAFAVVGARAYTQEAFLYSFIWAGQVEYL